VEAQPYPLVSMIPWPQSVLSTLAIAVLVWGGFIGALKGGSPIDHVIAVGFVGAIVSIWLRPKLDDGFEIVPFKILLAAVTISWLMRSKAGRAVLLVVLTAAAVGFGQIILEIYRN